MTIIIMKIYTINPEFIRLYNNYKQIYRKHINAAKAYDLEKQTETSKNINTTV